MGNSAAFSFTDRMVGALPIVNRFLERLGMDRLLDRYLPHDDPRLKISPAAALGVLVRSLVVEREPVYALGRWASRHDPAVLGLTPQQVSLLNDDRVGRMLDRLFECDRASLLTELVVGAIKEFGVDCSTLHNDSTSISLQGAYSSATGASRGGKPTPKITHGHSKALRPDLKQLIWILTISEDGAVPIAHRVADGNTEDTTTHIPTWEYLVELVGNPHFLYVADSKLCTRAAMDHISHKGGRFLTVMPKGRSEVDWFRRWLQSNSPEVREVLRRPTRRGEEPSEIWRAAESPIPSAEGYRIVWIWSSSKQAADLLKRQERIMAGMNAMHALHQRLAKPRSRFRNFVAVEQKAQGALQKAKADRWVRYEVSYVYDTSVSRRTMKETSRARVPKAKMGTRFSLGASVDEDAVAYDAKCDGWFPLITNDREMSVAELLAAHKYQPKLESRHADLKGTLQVAPMFLKNPARIEALLLCEFIALLVHALIEREIRASMTKAKHASLPLYPEERASKAPTAARVLETFSMVMRHDLMQDGKFIQIIDPELSELQTEVLKLLKVKPTAYSHKPDR